MCKRESDDMMMRSKRRLKRVNEADKTLRMCKRESDDMMMRSKRRLKRVK
jgi:hypothetical protein